MKTTTLLLFTIAAMPAMAQDSGNDYVRRGNRLYRDSIFDKAEVMYLKALDTNHRNTIAQFNAGNAMLMQNKGKEAMEQYEAAAMMEKDKMRKSKIYHNMGWIMQANQKYAEAAECYKNALRNNPNDDETRYNLVLCQRQLKDQQQDQNGGGNGGNDKQQDQQSQEQQKQQQQQQDEQQQQQQQQAQPKENEMSRENAEQLLQAAMQDEKQTQDKMQKQQQQPSRRRLQKQW